jgi:hypothetical protein
VAARGSTIDGDARDQDRPMFNATWYRDMYVKERERGKRLSRINQQLVATLAEYISLEQSSNT